jgi:hypothetical protein
MPYFFFVVKAVCVTTTYREDQRATHRQARLQGETYILKLKAMEREDPV